MSDEDMKCLIAWLRSDKDAVQPSEIPTTACSPSLLTKFLCRVAFKALPYPTQVISPPDRANLQAYGKYLVLGRYDCWTCHSADFKTINFTEPERTPGYCQGGNTMYNLEGHKIYTANITPDAKTGIGDWTIEDFRKVLRESHRRDGRAIRYPMLSYNLLPDYEIEAIWQYLRSIPPITNPVDRQWDKEL